MLSLTAVGGVRNSVVLVSEWLMVLISEWRILIKLYGT
jgi:hypothetical protein